MIKEVEVSGKVIRYDLQHRNVKNINLRVKSDGSVHVSANKHVPQYIIDAFVISKADFIFRAAERLRNLAEKTKMQYYSEDELKEIILKLCKTAYPYYEARGIRRPEIKLRKMVSRWGSCQPQKGILTFNTNLIYAPFECIEYVVLHEFTHFLQANHSNRFYEELEKVCPKWQEIRAKMKEINIR